MLLPPPAADDPFAARVRDAAHRLLEDPERVLQELSPRLEIGAVYWVPDAWTGRTDKPEVRPAAIVRRLALAGPADIVMMRPVHLSVRLSWKDHFGPPPLTDGERLRFLKEMHWLFTPAGLMPGWTKDGIFEIRPLRPIPLWKLAAAEFEGYLGKPEVDLLAACATGARVANPYPPVER